MARPRHDVGQSAHSLPAATPIAILFSSWEFDATAVQPAGAGGGITFPVNHVRNAVVTPAAVCSRLLGMDAKAIRRAALITLRRAICERFRLGGINGCIGLRRPRRHQARKRGEAQTAVLERLARLENSR